MCVCDQFAGLNNVCDWHLTTVPVYCGFGISPAYWPTFRRWYGAPISRKRLYIMMIRKDVMTDEAKAVDFGTFIKNKLDGMKVHKKVKWHLI